MKKRKLLKQGFSLLLVAAMVLNLAPITLADLYAAEEQGEQTVLDINKGDITIGNGFVNGYSSDGVNITTPDEDGYVITGKTTEYVVTIKEGVHNITFDNLNIDVSGTGTSSYSEVVEKGKAPVSLEEGAQAEIILVGENTLKGGVGCAGIYVTSNSEIVIDGSGELKAIGFLGGAGIGANYKTATGVIRIEGGYINAVGSNSAYVGSYELRNYAAGIGGSSTYDVGKIYINGGNVFAEGSLHAADIGSGSDYISNFTSFSYTSSEAVIEINGGCIVADKIGNGKDDNALTETVINKNSEVVSKCTVSLLGVTNGSIVNSAVGLPDGFGISGVKTIGKELYLYVPEGTEIQSILIGDAQYKNQGDNIFFNELGIVSNPQVNIEAGDIILDINTDLGDEGVNYYTVDGGVEVFYTGTVTVKGAVDVATTNTVTVRNGIHDIILENVNIDVSETGNISSANVIYTKGSAGITIQGTSNVSINLKGDNTLLGGAGSAGLSVGGDAGITIAGEGSLNAVGGLGAAGIGADNMEACGTITINSGFITAKGTKQSISTAQGRLIYSAGIGGCSNYTVGTITINGGTIIASDSNMGYYYAADIGSGMQSYYDYSTNCEVNNTSDSTVIINGGNIKADRIGSSFGTNEHTSVVTNSNGDVLKKLSIKLLKVPDRITIDEAIGLPEYYNIDNAGIADGELHFWVPEDVEITSVYVEDVEFTNNGINVFINETDRAVAPEVNIAEGNIVISTEYGEKYYTVGNGDKNYYVGQITIKGDKDVASNNTITVSDGTHQIALENVYIDVSDTGTMNERGGIDQNGRVAFALIGESNVVLKLVGDNTLKSGIGCAGLSVPSGTSVTIESSGSLNAVGNTGGAGIGAGYYMVLDYIMSSGDITINDGSIVAVGNGYGRSDYDIKNVYNAAGIGGYNDMAVGNITINGGNVKAIGGTVFGETAPAIGSGYGMSSYQGGKSYYSADVTVIINGGNIEADYIGAGRSDQEVTATVKNSSHETVSKVTISLEDVTGNVKVDRISDIGEYGLNGVYTVDGVLYLYLPVEANPTVVYTTEDIYVGNIIDSVGEFRIHECSFDTDKAAYIADESTDTIFAVCDICGKDMGSVMLYSPVNNGATDQELVYDGTMKEARWEYLAGQYTGSDFIDRVVCPLVYVNAENGEILSAPPVNVGNYLVALTIDDQTVSIEFTINKIQTYIGDVTAEVLNDTLNVEDVVLHRTEDMIAGSLVLADTELQYGTHTYNWRFIPENPNYEVIEGTVSITVNDTIAPTLSYKIDNGAYKDFASLVTFELFSKSDKTIELQCVDNDGGSGIATQQYYIADGEVTDLSTIAWVDYTEAITINTVGKYVVYVRVADNGGNELIKHTEGIVIYEDCIKASDDISINYDGSSRETVDVLLNGNTLTKIVDATEKELDANAYMVLVDGYIGKATIVLNAEYLDSLQVGEYTYTMYFLPQGVKSENVELKCTFKVTVEQAEPVIGIVTSDVVYDTLDVNAVVLSRTDKTLAGSLVLTDTELQYGTHIYNWKFTPESKNYEVIEGTVAITVKDTKAPIVSYKIDNGAYKDFASIVTFGLFSKSNKTIEIQCADNDGGSDIATQQYYIADGEIKDLSSIVWVDYTQPIKIDKIGKYVVYVRVVDNGGNEIIKHTEGIVIYGDSAKTSADIIRDYDSNKSGSVDIVLNGNTIISVVDVTGKVLDSTTYTVNVNGTTGKATITLRADYLDTLQVGKYAYTVYFAPQDVQSEDVELKCSFNVTVTRKNIADVQVALDKEVIIYNGNEQTKHVISVKLDGKDITYIVSGNKGTDIGEYELIITGVGNYEGVVTVVWSIVKPPYIPEGVCKAEDGNWYYYVSGNVDTSYTGLAENQYGCWYIINGKVDFEYTGLEKNQNGWWYISKGKLDTSYTGMAKNEYGWWYITKGKVDTSYTGMAKNQYGWWYITKGKLDTSYTGMAKNEYGWWYITKGKLDTSYTGMAKNEYGWWYITKGKLDTSYTGMAQNQYGWWYMTKGKLDTIYTGIAENKYGSWYMSNGRVDFAYTGMVKYANTWWYITKGKFDLDYTGMAKNEYGWWHMTEGKLDTSYTGISTNAYGKWYITNGKFDTTYSGYAEYEGTTYKVENGKVIK